MTSSTVFTSNRSQAVRLPKAVAFPDDVHRVDILRIGRSRVIVRQGQRWDDLFEQGPRATDDFMAEREQPPLVRLRGQGVAPVDEDDLPGAEPQRSPSTADGVPQSS
jgi:antitoxin VapB